MIGPGGGRTNRFARHRARLCPLAPGYLARASRALMFASIQET